jgi:hypothetical protein
MMVRATFGGVPCTIDSFSCAQPVHTGSGQEIVYEDVKCSGCGQIHVCCDRKWSGVVVDEGWDETGERFEEMVCSVCRIRFTPMTKQVFFSVAGHGSRQAEITFLAPPDDILTRPSSHLEVPGKPEVSGKYMITKYKDGHATIVGYAPLPQPPALPA